jgi:hypothetical protein
MECTQPGRRNCSAETVRLTALSQPRLYDSKPSSVVHSHGVVVFGNAASGFARGSGRLRFGKGLLRSTCSAWIWHGGSYSAVWSIGAVGQLTVSGAKDGEISFQRTDTAGLLAGLSGTYAGRFDGARFVDGKVTFSLKGSSNPDGAAGMPRLRLTHTHVPKPTE